LWNGGRTDSTSVDLDSSVEIGQIADCVGALGDDGAGDGEAAEGEDGEVGETHLDGWVIRLD
jgi:hypothetical protein